MKFSEMPYTRPDPAAFAAKLNGLTDRIKKAADYGDAKHIFLECEQEMKRINTLRMLASIRRDLDTRDPFYREEAAFWCEFDAEITKLRQEWKKAMLDSPFREDFSREYGELLFLDTEMTQKTFSNEIVSELKRESELVNEYFELFADSIPFEGGYRTMAELWSLQTDADDARRLAAWNALGRWYKDRQQSRDGIFDELVKLRDAMGRKLGYDGFTGLGYCRMKRNCYTKDDVEVFRKAVQTHLVPVADRIMREQAKRIGRPYPVSFADAYLNFRGGNPNPVGGAENIIAQGKKLFDLLSPESSEFFKTMLDNELMDLLPREGKIYNCFSSSLYQYEAPFIYANFTGTYMDVIALTHEGGHAFADRMNLNRIPLAHIAASMDISETHAMSMEFFGWLNAEGFFGSDARKFCYSHLSNAITQIPYGAMVDHFQHIIYEKPELTPAERHAEWKRLMGIYMPWIKLDGEIPFFSEGMHWQMQGQIYASPFYYIDYCLAQTAALQIWVVMQSSPKDAWERYMAFCKQGGTCTFTELLNYSGLTSPFDEECLKDVCAAVVKWLENFDMRGIE